MSRVQFVELAKEEFLAQVDYYEQEAPGLGDRFARQVEEAPARALAFPAAGSSASKSTRRVFLKDFPFAVVYRPRPEGIVVFAIAHHARRPGYWRARDESP